MNLVALLHLVVAVLTIALALPLIRRKVPMNNWYGVRIAAAFESDEQWYEINAYAGWVLLGWGAMTGLIAGVGLALGRRYWMPYTWIALTVMIAGLGVAAALVLRRAAQTVPPVNESSVRAHPAERG